MATKNELISDIELRLYKSKPSDDSELSRSHIYYLINNVRNEILSYEFNDSIKRGLELNPFYIKKLECNQLIKETPSCSTDCTDFKYYFSIGENVMSLYKDMGIIRIEDNYGRSLVGTNQNFSEVLFNLPYNNSSTIKQSFFRENDKIYVKVNDKYTSGVYKYTIYYIPENVSDTLGDDDEYPLESSLVPELLNRVEEILRRQMQGGVVDLDNDGTDPYHQ